MHTRRLSRRIYPILILVLLLIAANFACDGDADDEDDPGASHDDDNDQTDDDDDGGESTGGRLVAGAASGYLKVPIGVSLGGFAMRFGPRMAYNAAMGGSRGYLDRPVAKAVALQVDDRRLVIAKVSMMGVTESLRTQVVNQVREQIGVDLDRGLVLTASHTHSGPARFLPVPDIMSLVGADKYSAEIVDRIADSLTEVIVTAIQQAEPARIGFGYREPFDPNSLLTRDRRCANGPGDFREDRLWVGRVENDDGETMAMLVGMAMHGVVFGFGAFDLTDDAPGGVERAIEAGYDHPVTALYIQGSAGDVVPQMWGPQGHRRMQIIEWIGSQVAAAAREVDETIVTDDQPEFRVLTRRYVTDRETLGYQPGEFGHYNLAGQFVEYRKGAMECGVLANERQGSISDCDNPETTLVDGYLGCLVDLDWPLVNKHTKYFMQSPITVAQVGDQFFFTAPGEVTSHLAVDIRQTVANKLDVPFANVNLIGYAQNYIFYILQDWDWWQGGGEAEGSLFGWRYGPWLESEVARLTDLMHSDTPPLDDDPPPLMYHPEGETVPVELSESLGTITQQPASQASRFDTLEFAWRGGHPGVDWLTVMLQQEKDGEFVDVLRPNGKPYDDKGWEMAVRLFPAPSYQAERERASREFEYRLEWETSYNDPSGVLRFKVSGLAKTDEGVAPYELFSEPFELSPVDSVTVYDLAAVQADGVMRIKATAAYPPSPLAARRIRSVWAGGSHPAICGNGSATARVTDANGNEYECELVFQAQHRALVGELTWDRLATPLTITIERGAFNDGFGNTNGEASEPLVVQP
ncbi:MAG: hypothetical protein P9L99_16685 [Candidatus Lernaella stagnicola]|nr:hypothetical protein [Candidatus Lernaella stagnicola]